MLVAAHALLGCCAHHACGPDDAQHGAPLQQVADHHGAAESGAPHHSGHEGGHSPEWCQHDTCSFVKCPPVRVDDGSEQVVWSAAELAAVLGVVESAGQSLADTGFSVASPTAKLFVRYRALLL